MCCLDEVHASDLVLMFSNADHKGHCETGGLQAVTHVRNKTELAALVHVHLQPSLPDWVYV
jgi:hypothetical protein